MDKIICFLTFVILQSFVIVGFANDHPKNKESQELKVRKGLPNFFEKASRGDSIKVAYLGGSITEQNGWRVNSLKWFQQRFPKATFLEINAAIGGTGSDFGVFRLHDHVLKFKPDLVFVEFAVNDGNTPSEKITRSMEGIVRQIWKQNPRTDICFIYTITAGFLPTVQKGQLPASAQTMEQVADNYQVPSINFGFEVSKMVSNKQLVMNGATKELNGVKVFSPDGVHPYPEIGHVIYLEVLKRSFEKMLENSKIQSFSHKLSNPITTNYFANTQMLDFTVGKLSESWDILQITELPSFARFDKFLSQFGRSSKSGESLTIHFKGKTIGICDFMGPDAGKVIIEIDGNVLDTISRFDEYCTYYRLNYFLIDNLEDKYHLAVFKTLCVPFNKVDILKKRGQVMKNPDDYKGNNWYVGKILLDGILIN